MITDDTGPIGLAAVMGGASTEIGDGTTAVLLEAAHWEPTGVARTARRHRLPSEAAKRFERGVDPEMTVVALARAAAAARRVRRRARRRRRRRRRHPAARGRPSRSTPPGPPGSPAWPTRAAQVVELLEAVGCTVDADGDPLPVTPPSWRPDLTDPADLVEEVVRLAGYDDVPSVLPTAPPGRGLTDVQRRRRGIGRTLAEAGYVEAPSYPFVATSALDALGLPDDDARRPGRRGPQPAVGGGAGAADDAAARPAGHAGAATSAAASATWPCSSTARCSPAATRSPAPLRAWTGVRTTRRWPRCSTPCRTSRGTWRWP